MSDLPTWLDIPSATSSQASEYGATPYVWQDGPTTAKCGLDHARANLSARQAKEKGLLTSGTYGLPGSTSSSSADLASSLANRLKQQLSTVGSTLFKLTWKDSATPSGRPVSLLRASAHRTVERGCGSWPTTTRQDAASSGALHYSTESGRHSGTTLTDAARMASWPTPNAMPENRGGLQSNPQKALERRERGHQLNLDDAACLASWATPTTRDHKDTGDLSLYDAERRETTERYERTDSVQDLADPDGGQPGDGDVQRSGEHGQQPEDGGASSGVVGNANIRTVRGNTGTSDGTQRTGGYQSDPDNAGASGSVSFWSVCDWLPCRDGKARPVEPGSFPLVNGAPARMGRLRAYGNAIVPQVAAEVIRAYMDVHP